MPCVRASSLLWSANCWSVRASRATPRHAWLSSTTSRDGTILTGAIQLLAMMLQSLMKGGFKRLKNSIPTLSTKAGQLQFHLLLVNFLGGFRPRKSCLDPHDLVRKSAVLQVTNTLWNRVQ